MSFISPWRRKTGFQGKTLWDWMQLLIVPAVLAGVGLAFNAQSARTQQALAEDIQQEASFQAYIDSMADHLLQDTLRRAAPDAEIRSVARTRTLATLRRLDNARKVQLVQFLYESGLLTGTSASPAAIVELAGAELRGVDLHGVDLHDADLGGADLQGANLRNAALQGVKLDEADLRGADLQGANLRGADLRAADLTGADVHSADLRDAFLLNAVVTDEQLVTSFTLKGARLPDGTEVPADQDFPPVWN